jgi:RNA polymerase sigma-70 factor (ECF subfamily)
MSNTETLVSVIEGVRSRDPQRWQQFDTIYRPMLLAFLKKRGLKDSDAGDIVQDIFVKLLAKIHSYDRAKSSFRAWLFTVAHHTLIDEARRRASRKRAADGWVLTLIAATTSDSVRMEKEWTRIHRERILAHALRTIRKRVSSRAWACFEQRVLNDRPGAEIASDLGIPSNAVFVTSCRVMKQVRDFCEEFDEDMSHAFQSELSWRR